MKKLVALLVMAGFLLLLCSCGSIQAPGETAEPSAYTESVPSLEPSQPRQSEDAEQILLPTGPETVVPCQPEPADSDFVPVRDYIPDLAVELKYSTEENFTGKVIYEFRDAYLRYGTVKKLMAAQQQLSEQGLGLKLWDSFRPVSAQYTLWDACPDPAYVANPNNGFSSHSRGNTVDITLVDASGQEMAMPTGFDDFSARADRDYSDCTEEVAANAMLLQAVMEDAGFRGYAGEWWHFSDEDTYPVEGTFEPLEVHLRLAVCEEYITLRTRPDAASGELAHIPKNVIFTVLARHDGFLLVSYEGLRGYVLECYTEKLI